MRHELRQALERVARRVREVRFWSALALCWAVWGIVGAVLLAVSSRLDAAVPTWRLLGGFAALAVVTGLGCAAVTLRSARDRRWVARRIEARHPDLGTGLLAAVEEDAAAPTRLGFLQAAVIRTALEHRRTHDWDAAVPGWKLKGAKLAHAAALAMLIVVGFSLATQARSRQEKGLGGIAGSVGAAGLIVEPGNAEVERGTPLLVVARFGGAAPAEASLVVEGNAGTVSRQVMTRSLEDPTFAGRVESVETDLSYRVEYDGQGGETYRVKVFEYPEVERTDARLNFPAYTSLEPKTVEDVRHVTAVEGTELTLLFRLNKPVATARLVDEKGQPDELTPDKSGENVYAATITLADPQRYRVELVDTEGRPNKTTTEIAVNVVRNRPAVVKVSRPAHDVRVSPVEELTLGAKLEDDFGVVRQGVSYTLAGSEPKEVVLDGPPNARKIDASHLLDFEAFAAEPDQLVSYYFWAEDVGPDGEPRRTSGDMFFAEVRSFEEIFRQGEQPAGGQQQQQGQQQGGAAQQAMQLAELQKEIINGTWKLIRRETGKEPSAGFEADAKLLLESQRSAIEQAAGLAGQLQDPESKSKLDQATGFMDDAAERLAEAAESAKVPSLQPALVAEQAAYQALLKLRDREFNVVRGQQQQGGGGGGGGPSQQQLQQLELSNEENRYEERRTAQAQDAQQQEQRETRQVLNRLRELARRQDDLNERLKELQSALEAAKDEEERQELERQLKRLRDQEQQILRDTDELRERMEREENRDRMADARQQVEESRERVRQASEALEEGRVSQALTEGTRAGRQFDELSEQLRKETSNRFSEEMTEMRDEARRLDETQDELSEQLEAAGSASQRSLRGGEDRRQVRQQLETQRQQLERLLDRMRQTVQEAEEPEPLLAEKLFDTVREAEQQSIPDALKAADRLADLGIAEEAAKASRDAGEGFDRLREGVEDAAESVLGDEIEALKRAQEELEDLADQVDQELGRGGGSGEQPEGQARSGGGAESRDGQRSQQGGGSEQGDPSQEQSQREGAGSGEPTENEQQGEGRQAGQTGQQSERDQQGGGGQQQPDQQSNKSGGGQGEQAGQPSESQGQQPSESQDGQGQNPQQDQQGQGQQQGPQLGGGGGSQQPNSDQNGQRGPQGGSLRDQAADERQGGKRGSPNGGNLIPGMEQLLDGGFGPTSHGGPITGEGFREWSDRMRDVEELLEDSDLRAEAARIRDRVRGAREEFKRHSKVPEPDALNRLVAEPLHELRNRVAEEVRRRESPDSLVPIDRDPVPPAYAEGVRRYYERLGTGR